MKEKKKRNKSLTPIPVRLFLYFLKLVIKEQISDSPIAPSTGKKIVFTQKSTSTGTVRLFKFAKALFPTSLRYTPLNLTNL